MIITRAHGGDLDAIEALEGAGFAEASWSREAWQAELDGEDRCVLVARDGEGRAVGVATFQTVFDSADLHRVVVSPEHRGQGIGGALVRAGLQWAQALGATQMLLEVRHDNPVAVSLYRTLGFLPIDQRRDYYAPGAHALVMMRALAVEPEHAVAGWGMHV